MMVKISEITHSDSFNRLADALLLVILCSAMALSLGDGGLVLDPELENETSSAERIFFYLEMLAAICLTVICGLNPRERPWVTSVSFILPYMAIVALSIPASSDPKVSLNHFIRMTAVLVSANAYVRLRGPRELIGNLALVFASINILSIIAVILLPEYGRHSALTLGSDAYIGNWKGITPNKNSLGRIAAICAVLVIAFPDFFRWGRRVSYSLAAVCTVNVFGSESGAGIIVLLSCLFLSWGIFRKGRDLVLYLVWLMSASSLLILLLLFPDHLFSLIGKDSTGTGRADIWYLSWEIIRQGPLLGYGFDAGANYWRPIMQATLFPSAVDAHNAYLQTAIDIGWLGLAMLVFAIGSVLRIAFKYSNDLDTGRGNAAFGMIVIAATVLGLVEISPFSITADIGVATFIALTGICRRSKLAPH